MKNKPFWVKLGTFLATVLGIAIVLKLCIATGAERHQLAASLWKYVKWMVWIAIGLVILFGLIFGIFMYEPESKSAPEGEIPRQPKDNLEQGESEKQKEVPEPNQSANDSKKNAWQHARDFFTEKPKVAFWTKGVVGAIAALLVIFLFANLFSKLGTDEREQIANESKHNKTVVVTSDTIHNANGQDTIHRHVTIVNDTTRRTEPSASKSAGSETEQVAEEKPAEEKSWWDKLTGGSSGKSEAEQIKELEAKERLAKKEEKRQSKKVDSNGDNSDISAGNTSSNRPSQTRQPKTVPTYYKNIGNETWVDGPESETQVHVRPRNQDTYPGEQNYNQGGCNTVHGI